MARLSTGPSSPGSRRRGRRSPASTSRSRSRAKPVVRQRAAARGRSQRVPELRHPLPRRRAPPPCRPPRPPTGTRRAGFGTAGAGARAVPGARPRRVARPADRPLPRGPRSPPVTWRSAGSVGSASFVRSGRGRGGIGTVPVTGRFGEARRVGHAVVGAVEVRAVCRAIQRRAAHAGPGRQGRAHQRHDVTVDRRETAAPRGRATPRTTVAPRNVREAERSRRPRPAPASSEIKKKKKKKIPSRDKCRGRDGGCLARVVGRAARPRRPAADGAACGT